jgi:type II secretory pathway component PulF
MFKKFMSKQFGILTIVNLAIALSFLIIVLVLVVGAVPNIMAVYWDFGAELPFLTRILFNVASIFRRFWYIVVPLSLVIAALISVGIAWLFKDLDVVTLVVVYVGVMFVGVAAVVLSVSLGIYLPLYSLASHL